MDVTRGSVLSRPVVSVLTATYNHRAYIARCLDSVLNQDFIEWEQVIVDDGSNDGTDEVVRRYNDSRITYIKKGHSGIEKLNEVYNRGLRECKAPLIAILEGDDFWPPWKLSTQLPVFNDSNILMSYGTAGLVDSLGREYGLTRGFPNSKEILHNDPPGSILKRLLFSNFIPAVTCVIRKEELDQVGGFQQAPGTKTVDTPTWFALSLRGKFSYLPEKLGYWRRHRMSATMSATADESYSIHDFFLGALGDARRNGTLMAQLWYLEREVKRFIPRGGEYLKLVRARRLAIDHKWIESRIIFKELLSASWPLVRMAALIGYVGTFLHKDIEGILRWYGVSPMRL